MGFKTGEGNVYVCSDSQATGEEKSTAQKLFVQGSNAFTGTGRADRILSLRASMLNLQNPTPKQLAELLIERGKDFKIDRKDPNDYLAMLVAGVEEKSPVLYHVSVSGTPNMEPEYAKIDYASFDGSGRRQTMPAIQRDIETGNIDIFDATEGMNLCFSLGDRAGRDMYVDDKFQISLVTPDGVRILYHPRIDLGVGTGPHDYFNYFRANFDINLDTDKLKDNDYEGLSDIYAAMNDLYNSLLVTCGNINSVDRRVNRASTMAKVDRVQRDKHELKRQEFVKERDLEKSYTNELVNAWISGNVDRIVEALGSYRERRVARYENGQAYVSRLQGNELQIALPFSE